MRALVYLKVLEQFRLSLTYVIVSLEGAIHSILALYQLAFQRLNSQLCASFALLGRELHPVLPVISLFLALLSLPAFLIRINRMQ